jgi:hypothetical protein
MDCYVEQQLNKRAVKQPSSISFGAGHTKEQIYAVNNNTINIIYWRG